MKSWHWILIAVVVVGGGLAAYFLTRKKTPTGVASNLPPKAATTSPLQQFEAAGLGFAFDEGKKALSDLFS